MAVLVVAALLSVAGALGTSASLAADDAEAASQYTCIKLGTTYYCQR
jgi:hypothetical protein